MKQQGPKRITIPEQNFNSCWGCEFHSHKLVVSGRNPKYAENCNHPKAVLKPNQISGNLSSDNDDQVKTPYWCPFLPKPDGSGGGHIGHGTSGNFMRTQIEEHG